jgi:hypothetical protein
MHLGMDGTGVPMRTQEVADRAGKQADCSAKTREAKLVTVWTAESPDQEGRPVRDPGSRLAAQCRAGICGGDRRSYFLDGGRAD